MRTVGDLTANMIGTQRIRITHHNATVAGMLMGLDIDTAATEWQRLADVNPEVCIHRVLATVTIGDITVGPLDRSTPCEFQEAE